ncbi:LPS assembly lipoprotein LptE [Fibrobacter sp.]|uniref:LPS assembly lipoprotein LptE n=1 Tax=Fibrobacter sp. TaxID=35828 RepID=UPI0025BF829D|nr:LPS assembly lipoprotein LptE [Fibrobacter sp.]
MIEMFRKMTSAKFLLACVVLAVAGALTGCYSFTASTLPSHIKTVQIHEVEDKTLDPVLANNIHTAVVEMFKKNAGGVRLVNDDANADFQMTLIGYTNKPENYNSNSDVETYRVTIRVSVKFYDNVKERIIYENKSLSAEGVYDVQKNEVEDRHGQARAIEKLQDLIIANALAKW